MDSKPTGNFLHKKGAHLRSVFAADFVPDDLPKLDDVSTKAQADAWQDAWHSTLNALDVALNNLGLENPPLEDTSINCNEQYHFSRFSGPGSNLAPRLYAIMLHVAKENGTFWASLKNLRKFLLVTNDNLIYRAVRLLVLSGFVEVIEATDGMPTKYRPIGHKQWAEKYADLKLCCKRVEKFPFPTEDDLGPKLYGILGGEKFFPNVLKGLRATRASDAQLLVLAKKFMEKDAGRGPGKERRKRFQQFVADVDDSPEVVS